MAFGDRTLFVGQEIGHASAFDVAVLNFRRHVAERAKVRLISACLFETLSGMQMSELFSKVRAIGDNTPRANGKETKS